MSRRGGNHQLETFLRCRKLGNVVVRVGASNVLLHRAVALLLLCVVSDWTRGKNVGFGGTPMHFFLHIDPSWLLRGQITSFSRSVEARNVPGFGGMAWRVEEGRRSVQGADDAGRICRVSSGGKPAGARPHLQCNEIRDSKTVSLHCHDIANAVPSFETSNNSFCWGYWSFCGVLRVAKKKVRITKRGA